VQRQAETTGQAAQAFERVSVVFLSKDYPWKGWEEKMIGFRVWISRCYLWLYMILFGYKLKHKNNKKES
jgi:hypothetical protein